MTCPGAKAIRGFDFGFLIRGFIHRGVALTICSLLLVLYYLYVFPLSPKTWAWDVSTFTQDLGLGCFHFHPRLGPGMFPLSPWKTPRNYRDLWKTLRWRDRRKPQERFLGNPLRGSSRGRQRRALSRERGAVAIAQAEGTAPPREWRASRARGSARPWPSSSSSPSRPA